MCHGASDEFKNMQYEDGMSSTYPQCPKAHARKELLHFLLDTQNTECKVPSCHGQRLVLRRAQATYEVVLCSEFDLQFLTPNVTNQYDHVVFRIPSRCEKITSLMSNASSSSSGGRISVQQVLRTIHTQGQFCDSLYSPSRVPRSLNCYRHTPAIPPEERDGPSLQHQNCNVRLTRVCFPNNPGFNFSLVIVQGQHTHPPCPRSQTPDTLVEQISDYMQTHPTATAFMVATDYQLWKGLVANEVHPSLSNQTQVDTIVKTARQAALPHGDGVEGCLHALVNVADLVTPWTSVNSGYVRELHAYDDGHCFVLCARLTEYERNLIEAAMFLEMDIYFKTFRKPWTCFSISTWDSKANMQVVLARLPTNKSKVSAKHAQHVIHNTKYPAQHPNIICRPTRTARQTRHVQAQHTYNTV